MAVLAWAVAFLGENEEEQIWLYTPVGAAEVDALYTDRPQILADWLRPMAGRQVYVGIAAGGVLISVNRWQLPGVPGAEFTTAVAAAGRC